MTGTAKPVTPVRTRPVNQDDEIHFRATETLENGIQVGARIQLEGATHNGNGARFSGSAGHDQIDERHIFFKGGFGEIRVGDEDDARKLKSYTAPDPTGYIFAVNSRYWRPRPRSGRIEQLDHGKPRERLGEGHLLHAVVRRIPVHLLLRTGWNARPHRFRHRRNAGATGFQRDLDRRRLFGRVRRRFGFRRRRQHPEYLRRRHQYRLPDLRSVARSPSATT